MSHHYLYMYVYEYLEVVFLFSGGYTAGPKKLTDLLRNRSRPYLFSNSLPPPVVACANKVFLSPLVA